MKYLSKEFLIHLFKLIKRFNVSKNKNRDLYFLRRINIFFMTLKNIFQDFNESTYKVFDLNLV